MFAIQMVVGHIFQVVPCILMVGVVPVIVIAIVLLSTKKFTRLKAFLMYTCLVFVIGFGLAKVFAGGAYQAAKDIGSYVPLSSQTLEKTGGTGGFPIDDEWDYTVIRLNETQSKDFLHILQSNSDWSPETIIPNSLLPAGYSLPSTKHPFPNRQTEGYVYFERKVVQRDYDDWTRKVIAFFDEQSRTLYVYYDYGQWG